MSLLDRARRKREVVHAKATALDQMHYDRDRDQHVRHIAHVLELDEGRITSSDLTPVHPDRLRWEDNLWQFDLEGHHFIVGDYWHGNPGRGCVLAVKVKAVRGKPTWPPPHPQSVHNTRWAPLGYKQVNALWQFAEAVDGR